MRFALVFILLIIQNGVKAQYAIDDFVGEWCVMGITQIGIDQQILFFKGECPVENEDCLIWELKSNMKFKRTYREYTYRDSLPTVVQEIQWGSEKWKYFKETKILYTGSDKYLVIKVDKDSLSVKRLE